MTQKEINEKENYRMLEELQERFYSTPEIKECRILNSDPGISRDWGSVFNFNSDGKWNGEVSNLLVEQNYSDLETNIVNSIKDELLKYCHDKGFEVFEDFSGNPACVITKCEGYRPTATTYTTSSSSRRNTQLSLLSGIGEYSSTISYEEGRVTVIRNHMYDWKGFPKNVHDPWEKVIPKEGELIELPKFYSK